jgi:twitching motility protein PilT
MSLGSFFLKAMLDLDGRAVVIDTATAPYVVTDAGPIEVANGALSINVIEELLTQFLPVEARKTLDSSRAVDTELPLVPQFPGEHFTLTAVRLGASLRIEIARDRRLRPAGEVGRVRLDPPEKPGPEDPAYTHVQTDPARGPAPDASASPEPVAMVDDLDGTSVIDDVHPGQSAPEHPERWRRTLPPLLVSPTAPPLELFETMALPPASEIARLLRLAAGRGASILYVASDAHPSIRVGEEVQVLEDEPVLNAGEAESLILAAMPRGAHNALRIGNRTEWISVEPAVGRVRCLSFRDVRGASGVFRVATAQPASVEQLGLPNEVQGLALEAEGLVLVTGPRLSGRGTLIAALVDLINRTRHVHVITLEPEILVSHSPRGSMISQREIRGDSREQLAAVRLALDEDPDVLVIEDLATDEVAQLALEAAVARLVIAGLSAHTVVDAIDAFVNKFRPDQHRRAGWALAENLRGSVAQASLARIGGGRVTAREVLLHTPGVAQLIAGGKTPQLIPMMEADESVGMISLNQALVGFVRSGDVDVREAYRHSRDRQRLLAMLT